MSKAEDLIEYSQNDEDIERLHKLLKDITDNYFRILGNAVENLPEEDIKELADYLLYFMRKHGKNVFSCDVSINKIKAFFCYFINYLMMKMQIEFYLT